MPKRKRLDRVRARREIVELVWIMLERDLDLSEVLNINQWTREDLREVLRSAEK